MSRLRHLQAEVCVKTASLCLFVCLFACLLVCLFVWAAADENLRSIFCMPQHFLLLDTHRAMQALLDEDLVDGG